MAYMERSGIDIYLYVVNCIYLFILLYSANIYCIFIYIKKKNTHMNKIMHTGGPSCHWCPGWTSLHYIAGSPLENISMCGNLIQKLQHDTSMGDSEFPEISLTKG